MNQKEITITAGLTQAANLITDVKDLSDEVLTRLIPLADILTDWLDLAKKEAIARARDGVCFDGFILKEMSRRRITDQRGALEAVQDYDPALVPLCQVPHLAPIKDLTRLLGRERFETIFSPFMGAAIWYDLVPEHR